MKVANSYRVTDIHRIKYYLVKTIKNHMAALSPDKISGRFNGPKILINSIPKAGTHLLESAMEVAPQIRNTNLKTISESWSSLEPRTLEKISKFKRGQIRTAHLVFYKEIMEKLEFEGVSTFLVIRHPLSIVVSHMKYVTYLDTHHPVHRYFLSLPNDRERLKAIIIGVPGVVAGIREVLEKFSGWLDCENVTVVRFEDLIGRGGGGSKSSQFDELSKIFSMVGMSLTHDKLEYIRSKTFNKKSLTFRNKSKTSDKDLFSEELYEIFYNEVKGVIDKYGYEIEKY